MSRRFERVEVFEKFTPIPTRKTKGSAGYDLYASVDTPIPIHPNEIELIPTGLTTKMDDGDVLLLFVRSSIAVGTGLMLANGVGVIDSDYYPEEILVPLYNGSDEIKYVWPNSRIAQGVFVKFGVTDDDDAEGERSGGLGSTGVR